MASSDLYRERARQALETARAAKDPLTRATWEETARVWLEAAAKADAQAKFERPSPANDPN